jgi:hypothetical protein
MILWLFFDILIDSCLLLPFVLAAMLQLDGYLGYLCVEHIPMHLSAHIWLAINLKEHYKTSIFIFTKGISVQLRLCVFHHICFIVAFQLTIFFFKCMCLKWYSGHFVQSWMLILKINFLLLAPLFLSQIKACFFFCGISHACANVYTCMQCALNDIISLL